MILDMTEGPLEISDFENGKYLSKLDKKAVMTVMNKWNKLYNAFEKARDLRKDLPDYYYDGMNFLQRYIAKQLYKADVEIFIEEGNDEILEFTINE